MAPTDPPRAPHEGLPAGGEGVARGWRIEGMWGIVTRAGRAGGKFPGRLESSGGGPKWQDDDGGLQRLRIRQGVSNTVRGVVRLFDRHSRFQ